MVHVNWTWCPSGITTNSALLFEVGTTGGVYVLRWPDGPSVGGDSGALDLDLVVNVGASGGLSNGVTWIGASPVAGVRNGVLNLSADGGAGTVWATYTPDIGMELAAGTFFGGFALVASTVGFLAYARSIARRLVGSWHRMEI